MPAPWAAGAEVRIVGSLHGQQCINVWHMATNTVINDDDNLDDLLLQLAQAMLECAVTTLLPAVTQDYTLVHVEAKRIYPATSDPMIATAPGGSVGELGPTSVSFAASLMNLRTGGGGKRGRGRKFLPPAGEANIATSVVDAGTLELLAEFALCVAGKFLGATPTTDWRLGIYSKTNDKEAGGTFDNSFRVVTQLSPVQDVARIGSRRKGRGA